jgi:hypothetical protein
VLGHIAGVLRFLLAAKVLKMGHRDWFCILMERINQKLQVCFFFGYCICLGIKQNIGDV